MHTHWNLNGQQVGGSGIIIGRESACEHYKTYSAKTKNVHADVKKKDRIKL